jgi:hypothetical protein
VTALREEANGDSTSGKMIDLNRKLSARDQIPRSEQEPPFPMHDGYLFQAFQDLSAARGSNGFGINPISYSEIEAYKELTGARLTYWDVRMIRRIDSIFLAASYKAQSVKAKVSQPVKGRR